MHTLLLHNSCLHRSLNALTTLDCLCQTMFSWQRNATDYRIKKETLLSLTYCTVSLMSPPVGLTSISPGLWILSEIRFRGVRTADNWCFTAQKGETFGRYTFTVNHRIMAPSAYHVRKALNVSLQDIIFIIKSVFVLVFIQNYLKVI